MLFYLFHNELTHWGAWLPKSEPNNLLEFPQECEANRNSNHEQTHGVIYYNELPFKSKYKYSLSCLFVYDQNQFWIDYLDKFHCWNIAISYFRMNKLLFNIEWFEG